MDSTQRYDAIIVGSGQGGNPLARALAGAGWKTALVEREHVGGTCINVGCTPTKTMVASARVAYLARRAGDFGVNAGPVSVDMSVVRRRKQVIVDDWRRRNERHLRDANVDLLMGEARFLSPRVLEVSLIAGGTTLIEAEKIFLDTGAAPAVPPIARSRSDPVHELHPDHGAGPGAGAPAHPGRRVRGGGVRADVQAVRQ